jgi:hypothetical protein
VEFYFILFGWARLPALLEFFAGIALYIVMSRMTEEIIEPCEALPPDKQTELADFARFLLARQEDEAWERSLADTRSRPKLEAFLRDAATEQDELSILSRNHEVRC